MSKFVPEQKDVDAWYTCFQNEHGTRTIIPKIVHLKRISAACSVLSLLVLLLLILYKIPTGVSSKKVCTIF